MKLIKHTIYPDMSAVPSVRCRMSGLIESPEINAPDYDENFETKYRKVIMLFDSHDPYMKPLAATVSNKNQTWEIVTAPEQENTKMFAVSFDLSETYNAQVYDRVSLNTKTYPHNESALRAYDLSEILIDRNILKNSPQDFINWLCEYTMPDYKNNRHYSLRTVEGWSGQPFALNVRTMIFECFNNWGDGNYIGIRSIEFYDTDGNLIPYSEISNTYTTSTPSTLYYSSHMTFNTSLSKVNNWRYTQWLSEGATNQRLIAVFSSPKNIAYMIINNGHYFGDHTNTGVKDLRITASSIVYSSTTWNSTIPDTVAQRQIVMPPHHPHDSSDDNHVRELKSEIIIVHPNPIHWEVEPAIVPGKQLLNVRTVVFECFNNWGDGNYIGIRRIEFYDTDGNLIPYSEISNTYTTSTPSTLYYSSHMTFNTSLSKVNNWRYTQWLSEGATNQRLIAVFSSPKNIAYMIINNGHYFGDHTNAGVKDLRITASSIVYPVTTWSVEIYNIIAQSTIRMPQHISSNTTDDQIIRLNSVSPIGENEDRVPLSLLPNVKVGNHIHTGDDSYLISEIDGDFILTDPPIMITGQYPIDAVNAFKSETEYYGTLSPETILYSKIDTDSLQSINMLDMEAAPETKASIYYALSFDEQSTYSIWTSSEWRHIATKLNSEWHYKTDTDTWSNDDIGNTSESALNKASTFTVNQMTSSVLNALTDSQYNLIFTDSLHIAATFVSEEIGSGTNVPTITINDPDTKYYPTKPISIDRLNISSSLIDWGYKYEDGLLEKIKVLAKVTGGTWQECTKGQAIPGVTAGMPTTEKQLFFRIEVKDEPNNCLVNLKITLT